LLENKNALNNRQVVLPFQFNAIELIEFPELLKFRREMRNLNTLSIFPGLRISGTYTDI